MERQDRFPTIRTEGALLPAEFLVRLPDFDNALPGRSPKDYGRADQAELREAISEAWSRCRAAWKRFRAETEKLAADDPGTSMTRDRWLLPLFDVLGYGRLPAFGRAADLDGKTYPISHKHWTDGDGRHHVPVGLYGWNVDLDHRTEGLKGAARSNPHGLFQEYLNRVDDALWAFVSNGRRLRVLRDNVSLTRQAYVEFDLEQMLEDEHYPDFVVLWLLLHESRVRAARPEECWLEKWTQEARQLGTAALDDLRGGVIRAIEAFGSGFLAHPRNQELREALRAGRLSGDDYAQQIRRLVYRLLFLFVAEERGLLLLPDTPTEVAEVYRQHYSTERLRSLSGRLRGGRHGDLWAQLRLVMDALGRPDGLAALGLPALGSDLWRAGALGVLEGADLHNADLLEAMRALGFVEKDRIRRRIDYRALGAVEFGSVYESLLELRPELHIDARRFELKAVAGNERKTTGSYYTPDSLVQCLLDSALDPVLERARRAKDAVAAILGLKVCDPACGSGHFLIAAAHRIARALAAARSGDEEPSPLATRTALRDVVGRCLYGVDLNPLAVELCKVNLWLEAHVPGKPLGFLDRKIVHGNALLGAVPAGLARGIPDAAFDALVGDDKAVCKELKKLNKDAKKGQGMLAFDVAEESPAFGPRLRDRVREIDAIPEDTVDGVREREVAYLAYRESREHEDARLVADAWCAAFVLPKVKGAPVLTEREFRELARRPERVSGGLQAAIEEARGDYAFLHWHIAFPEVFAAKAEVGEDDATGWDGGFDVVLGNPPWERVKLQEREWFASRDEHVASAGTTAERQKRIEALRETDPTLFEAFQRDLRKAEAESRLLRDSARFPLCGRGDVNTYTVFTELDRNLASATGRAGIIVPSGIATDDTTKHFFADLIDQRALASLHDFENRNAVFPGVHRSYKFCLLTMSGPGAPVDAPDFVFFALDTADLADEQRHFTLTAEDIALLNPNTKTCPVFRSRHDAEITKRIYRQVPVLWDENREDGNPWGLRFMRMLDMSNDSGVFHERAQLENAGWTLHGNAFVRDTEVMLPLYEAKMVHHFDHRFGDYADLPEESKSVQLPDVPLERLQDPDYQPLPRYWVPSAEVEARLRKPGRAGKPEWEWPRDWLLGWRDICRSTDIRTMIAGVIPRVACGDKFLLAFIERADLGASLLANLDSFIFDFATRQKIGGTSLKYFTMKQLPALPPATFGKPCPWAAGSIAGWITPRVLELTYTSHDLAGFARDHGYDGPPFRYDPARRFLLRCELDAAFFHLYGLRRDDVDYVMETFPIVKRKDIKEHGDYRTKLVILDIYDAIQSAIDTGETYATVLDPPPARGTARHDY